MRKLITTAIAIILSSAYSTYATVQPAGIFTDGAVLQQREPVRIWGTAAVGEKVTVKFAGQVKNTIGDQIGKWIVTLDKMPACAQGRPLIFQGSETAQPVELNDVLVGEVWLAGGQSNMETSMGYFNYRKTTQQDIDNINDPLLRMVTIPKLAFEGQNHDKPVWRKALPQYLPAFSACAYYFAKNLRQKLKVPVGVVACSYGATPAEAWMSRNSLEGNPALKRIIDAYDSGWLGKYKDEEGYRKAYKEYVNIESRRNTKPANNEPSVPAPVQPMGPMNYMRPGGLYETMLSQTVPYTFRGVIWYQGENNAISQSGFDYRTVFPALIHEWREKFQNKNMPFLFVQLATYSAGGTNVNQQYWPDLRESQSWTEDNVKNTGMIVLVDGGEKRMIHPDSKDKAGFRLSLLARNMVYGEKKLISRGPRLKSLKNKKGTIVMTFKDTGSGLVLKPETDSGFEICGADRTYVPAEAKLVNGKIIVSAASVPKPQFVRYGWKDWFIPTLFNKEGLPASPFRTDDFPPISKGRYYLDPQMAWPPR